MKELAAYLLLVLGGKKDIVADDVSALITAAGGEVNEEKLQTLLSDLEGKDIHELLAKGDNDLKSVVSVAGPAASAGETF
jgi:large subunit ribosomal protein LP2